MGKGDKKRAQTMLNTQGTTAQNYLGGVQNQLGGMNNNLMSTYWGSPIGQPNTAYPRGGFTGGYNPMFPGDGTGGRTAPTGSTGTFGESQFRAMFPGTSLSSDQLKAREGELAKYGIRVLTNASGTSGKIKLPDGRIIDVIGGAGAGHNRLQWLEGPGGAGGMGAGGIVGQQLGDYNNLMRQWQGWADTGGLSAGDKANIRSRAISPIRSVYSNAHRELDRSRALQGGYSPGYTTALGRFNREQGQLTSDATTNAEAAIAEMVQKGKLAGMGGMSSMYGATPGLADMFGRQALQGQSNLLQGSNLQNQLAELMVKGQIGQGSMAGFPWAKTLGTIGSIAAAIPTGGMSLAALPAMYAGSNPGGGFAGGGYI